jgi:uncharacterized protein (DUF58 family)
LWFAALAGIALIAAADAMFAVRSGTRASFHLPAIVRLIRDQPGEIPFSVQITARQGVRVAPALPPELGAQITVKWLPQGRSQVSWPCVPSSRGEYTLSTIYVEGTSPLGLWSVRTRVRTDSKLRVYPNLRNRDTAALLRREEAGLRTQRLIGRGREFEKLREYLAGDSFDEIHWKATAKRSRPMVKLFQVERTQEVYAVVDSSRLSARENAIERYVTAALHLGIAAERQGDLFGLLVFSDRVRTFVRARRGTSHFRRCRDAIYRTQPERVAPDFRELFGFIQTTLRRRALLVFLTALDDPVIAESFTSEASLCARRHLLVVNVLRIGGVQPLFEAPAPESSQDLYPLLAGQILWNRLRELEKALSRRGIRLTVAAGERLNREVASQYFEVKRRQAL